MKIFCVGIGGIGLSGVAQILRDKGHSISGSDSTSSEITDKLIDQGVAFYKGHSKNNLDASFELLIYSEAVPENNPERAFARELGIKQINYAKALSMISEGKKTIAITGTHGKTTVTGMLSSILLEAGLDPSIIIGSKLDLLDGQNFRIGKSDLFLCEACEYRDNFLELNPDILLINNLEPDHLDYFKNPENYFKSFRGLAEKVPETGTIILFEDDRKNLDLKNIKASVKIIPSNTSKYYQLQLPGKQNQHNARAAEEVAKVLGIKNQQIENGLKNFYGTWRRFEYKGSVNGAKVYDDYGHHPTEIKATIQAAREWYPDKNLTVIFQPHQYSRTHQFFDEFASSFIGADEVWITDIYKARDTQEDIDQTSAEKLSKAIQKQQLSKFIELNDIPGLIAKEARLNKVYLIMGAGNINQIFQNLTFDPKN